MRSGITQMDTKWYVPARYRLKVTTAPFSESNTIVFQNLENFVVGLMHVVTTQLKDKKKRCELSWKRSYSLPWNKYGNALFHPYYISLLSLIIIKMGKTFLSRSAMSQILSQITNKSFKLNQHYRPPFFSTIYN